MRLFRRILRVVAVALATVAAAVTGNQVLNGGKWSPWWLVAAIGSAIVLEGLGLWLGTRERAHDSHDSATPTLWPDLANNGMPLPLSEVTAGDLGVHPSRFDPDGNSPYVHREADALLAAALADDQKRITIAEGPRLAGTTSALA